jgi:hypothetical protein
MLYPFLFDAGLSIVESLSLHEDVREVAMQSSKELPANYLRSLSLSLRQANSKTMMSSLSFLDARACTSFYLIGHSTVSRQRVASSKSSRHIFARIELFCRPVHYHLDALC